MPGLLEGKVALVTGAASGIGREICYAFARGGARVVASDVDEEGGRTTVRGIAANGGQGSFIRADVSKASDSEALVLQTEKAFDALHVACNNAGIGGPIARTGEYPLDGWDKVIAINLSGVFYGMRYQLPAIERAGGGAIVNIASILGQVGFRKSPAYVAAKHGVVGLTRTAALEYADKKVRINAVGPGFTNTPLLSNDLTQEQLRRITALHPMGRIGEAREVAELVSWLSSDKASFVTGTYVAVDGGYLAQ